MTAKTILEALQALGLESYKRVLLKHGVPEPVSGVKIEELKKFQKSIGTNYQLALDLYATGHYDAMYLAGLIADDARMTPADLRAWAEKACEPLAGSTVPWVAAGGPHGQALAREWIEAQAPLVAACGWATWSSLVTVRDDARLDLAELGRLLARVSTTIHSAPDEVRSKMNSFVIAVGSFVAPLTELAVATGERIGPVAVNVGDTACRVPFAPEAIRKVEKRGSIGKKRKSAKC